MAQFDFKGQADISSIANTILTQKRHDEEIARQKEAQKVQLVRETAQAAGSLVAAAVEGSKNRQKRDFINTLAESAARTQAGVTPGTPTAMTAPQATKYDMVKSAVKLNPQEASKQILEQSFPTFPTPTHASTRAMPQPLKLKDGRSILSTFRDGKYYYPNTNEEVPADLIDSRAYAPSSEYKIVTDPVTKKQLRYNVLTEQLEPIEPPQQTSIPYSKRSLDEKKEVRASTEAMLNDDLLKSSELALSTVGNFGSVLNQDLSVSRGALKSLAARVLAGEKGVLTDRDVERVGGSTDMRNRFNNLVRSIVDNRATDQDYRELQSILEMATSRSSELYEQAQSQNLESLMTQYDLSEKEAKILLRYKDPAKVLKLKGRKAPKLQPDRATPGIQQSQGAQSPFTVDQTALDAELKKRGL